jgi:hypothetical protein
MDAIIEISSRVNLKVYGGRNKPDLAGKKSKNISVLNLLVAACAKRLFLSIIQGCKVKVLNGPD